MCSISVEPMPSTMSTPKWRLKRSPISAGSASPADDTSLKRHVLALRQQVRSEHVRRSRSARHRRPSAYAADAAAPALEHRLRRRPLGHEQRRRADAHRKGQRVAEPIGEEELGGREADVALLQAEDRLAVKLGRPVRVGVRMHRPLRPAGRARRIEPEGGIVGVGAGGLQERLGEGEKVLERELAEVERLGRARHDDGLRPRGPTSAARPSSAGLTAPLTKAAWARECSSM